MTSHRDRAPLGIQYTSALTRPLKAAEDTARAIVHTIVEDGLQVGEKLPSEAKMLDYYRVSRQSLREALRLLEVQGLIELKRGPGGGPVVAGVDAAHFGRMSSLPFHLVGVTYEELVEAWAFADGQLAALAARRVADEAVRTSLDLYLEVRPSAPEGVEIEEYVDLHSHFHHTLGGLCGNKALELTLTSFRLIFSHHLLFELDPRRLGPVVEREHADIARAVLAGDEELSRKLSEDHVHTVANYYVDATGRSLDALVEWR